MKVEISQPSPFHADDPSERALSPIAGNAMLVHALVAAVGVIGAKGR
jgi:hypothetical protein